MLQLIKLQSWQHASERKVLLFQCILSIMAWCNSRRPVRQKSVSLSMSFSSHLSSTTFFSALNAQSASQCRCQQSRVHSASCVLHSSAECWQCGECSMSHFSCSRSELLLHVWTCANNFPMLIHTDRTWRIIIIANMYNSQETGRPTVQLLEDKGVYPRVTAKITTSE